MATELLYPVLPMFLQSVGFSVLGIGFLEGLAEATSGLSKGFFGQQSDRIGKRVPFIQLGYGLSALSRPLMVLIPVPIWIFFTRTMDRMGKGIRTGARDALLSSEATPETKGRIFGFHRSMDTLGAVIGPLIAILYLYFYPNDYKKLFLLAAIPGVLAVLTSGFLKDKTTEIKTEVKSKRSFWAFVAYFKESPNEFKKIVIGLLVFTLCNSSDVFLLLCARQSGLTDLNVIFLYVWYNLFYAILAFPLGVLGDKIGLKRILILGLLLFTLVYGLISFVESWESFMLIFTLYGAFSACYEGVIKAIISNIVIKEQLGTAIGSFAAFQSIATLLASIIAGFIWMNFGMSSTFLLSGFAALIVAFFFMKNLKLKK